MADKPKKRKPSPMRDKNKERRSPFRRQKNKSSSSKRSNSRGRQVTPKKSKSFRADWVHDRINPDNHDIKILKKAIRSLGSSVRRNLNALRDYMTKGGMTPPALENLLKGGGVPSSKGDDYNVLYGEYLRSLEFMNDPTHTPKGAAEWQKNVEEAVEAEIPSEKDRPDFEERTRRYWKAFNRFHSYYTYMFAVPHFATDLIDATEAYCIESYDETEDMYLYIEKIGVAMYRERTDFFKRYSRWGWD